MLSDDEIKELDWELGNPWITRHTGRAIGQKLMKEVELLRAVVGAAKCEDNDEETSVLLAIDEMRETNEKITNKSIGSKIDMSAEQVRNARRRIKRTAIEIRHQFEERSKK